MKLPLFLTDRDFLTKTFVLSVIFLIAFRFGFYAYTAMKRGDVITGVGPGLVCLLFAYGCLKFLYKEFYVSGPPDSSRDRQ